MSNGDREVEKLLGQHREYMESIGNGITEGAWEGIREGISSGARKGAKDGLKKCLAAGFPNVDADPIEDIAGTISGLAISNNITKGTSEAIETSLKGYLDRLSDDLINGIRRQELPLGVDQIADVVELVKDRQQRIAQLTTGRLPHNPLSSAVVAGVQTAFDEGLDRSIRGFTARIREWLEAERDSQHEVVEGFAENRWAQQMEDLKSSVRRTVAAATEEAVARLIEQLTRRAIATLRKRMKDESLRGLEKAVRHAPEQKLEKGLDEGIRLLTEEMTKESADTMSFLTDLDESFGNSLGDYLSSLPQGPRFPLWKGLVVGGCVLAAAITGIVYALPSGGEGPEAVASIEWVDGSTVGFSSDGSSAPDGYIESYYWDFGDGSMSEEPSPVHTYEEGGDYVVVLTVADDEGETGEDAVHVGVAPPLALPDLVITEVGFGVEGHFFIIGYQVENHGEVQAGPSFIHMMVGDEEWCSDRVNALAAGGLWEGEFKDSDCLLSEMETSELWLKADATDLVRESDEANNTATPEFP